MQYELRTAWPGSMDVLNQYFLDMQAEFRYIHQRSDKLDPEMVK
ncbi:MAG: hypothetical protein ACRD9R_21390 [Pyrinomonadaceae bacterium]